MSEHQQLQRRLGVFDATSIGLGSMLGAGVFVVFAPAASLAGNFLALSVLIRGVGGTHTVPYVADLAVAAVVSCPSSAARRGALWAA